MLPYKKRRHFNDCWRPILEYMENAVKEDGSTERSGKTKRKALCMELHI
jgi:hypothetical protein